MAGALLAVPLRSLAQQQSKVWHVGMLSSGGHVPYIDEFSRGMRDLGYDEKKNLVIEYRFADGHFERLGALAQDLVNRRVDVIVGAGTPAIEAAKRATSTIPIVISLAGDPVASGLATSLAHPGGNITGLSLDNTDTSAKWLELARTVAPNSQIGVLADPNQPTAQWYVGKLQSMAQELGFTIPAAYAPAAAEIEAALASLARQRVATVIVLPGGMFFANREQIARSALKRRMASIATTRGYAEGGALLSYGQNYGAFVRRAATYVDKIFKGAKPSDLPIEQPTIFELVINRATAKQLSMAIPSELLLRADRVIE